MGPEGHAEGQQVDPASNEDTTTSHNTQAKGDTTSITEPKLIIGSTEPIQQVLELPLFDQGNEKPVNADNSKEGQADGISTTRLKSFMDWSNDEPAEQESPSGQGKETAATDAKEAELVDPMMITTKTTLDFLRESERMQDGLANRFYEQARRDVIQSNSSTDDTILLLSSKTADTLVYIDPPAPPSDLVDSGLACPPSSVPLRVHSQKLLETDSTYFSKLLQPIQQARIVRRRGLTGKLVNGIRYILDLTPPAIEDDAVIFITELSCPLAIRFWAHRSKRWKLPYSCTGGVDELEPEKRLKAEKPVKCWNAAPQEVNDDKNDEKDENKRFPVDYSNERHRAGVVHVLRALEGLHVAIDTPCKLWTFFSLAKIFDVATAQPICDRILSWFYEGNNVRFIEIHPDITYRIAYGIRCSALCRDAFAYLVGEEAFLLLSSDTRPVSKRRPATTIHGRICESLDDEELQHVEYASKTFVDYVVGQFINLAGKDMSWVNELGEFRKLLTTAGARSRELQSNLKDFIRHFVVFILQRDAKTDRTILNTSQDPLDYPSKDFETAYQGMSYSERLMSKTFWGQLLNEPFVADWSFLSHNIKPTCLADLATHLPAFEQQRNAVIRHIEKDELRRLAWNFNYYRETGATLPVLKSNQPVNHALPFRPRVNPSDEAGAVHNETQNAAATSDTGTTAISSVSGMSQGSDRFYKAETLIPTAGVPNPSWASTPSSETAMFPMDIEEPESVQKANRPSPTPTWLTLLREFAPQPAYFDLNIFLRQFQNHIRDCARKMLSAPLDSDMLDGVTDTLTCLREEEFKFLPLWAGGADDGTGGVFMDQNVPLVETGGFSRPGPAIHTGSQASSAGSFVMFNPSECDSTLHRASHKATESHGPEVVSLDLVSQSQNPEQSENSSASPAWELEDSSVSFTSNFDEDDAASDDNDTIIMGSPSDSDFFNEDEDLDMDEGSDSPFEEI